MSSNLEEAFLWQLKTMELTDGMEREYVFARPRRWRFDFAWPEHHVAIEVEGATWQNGRHTRGSGFEADCIKYAEAALVGWCVLRVTGAMVSDGRALRLAERALEPICV